jgi:competence protein ComGC
MKFKAINLIIISILVMLLFPTITYAQTGNYQIKKFATLAHVVSTKQYARGCIITFRYKSSLAVVTATMVGSQQQCRWNKGYAVTARVTEMWQWRRVPSPWQGWAKYGWVLIAKYITSAS